MASAALRLRRSVLLVLAAVAACGCALALVSVYRVQHTLTLLQAANAGRQSAAFSLRPLESTRNTGPFQAVPAAPSYRSGVQLDDALYLAGPEGLTVLAPDGAVRARLRTGLELPVAQIVAVAAGRLRGAAEPQVLLATAGAGVLILSPARTGPPAVRQLLPSSADAADVSALLVTASGDLLLGTRHAGVLLFSGSSLQPLPVPGTDAAHLQVTALAATDATSVLVGTRNHGAIYLHAGTAQQLGVAQGLPDDQVESLAVAARHVFIGTPLGIAELPLAGGPPRTLLPGVFAHTLAVSADGRELSVGTLDQGIRRVALGDSAQLHTASIALGQRETPGQRVDQLLPTQHGLLALVDGELAGRSAPLPNPANLTDRNLSALAFDQRGALFVGYFDRGLDVLANGAVTHLEDDALFCVNRLALDPARKTMVAATANGLVLFDAQGTPRQTLKRHDGLLSDHINDVAFTRTGTVLATPAGLTFVNAAGTESLYAFQGLVNNHVYALAADPATDHVLAGTLGGLSVLDAEQVRRNLTATNSGLKHNWVTALAQLSPGEWLVGTYGAGVLRLSAQGVFTPIDLPAGAPRTLVINPNALLVTATHVYAGTLGQGMLVGDTATGRWSLVQTGLPSLNVTAFAARSGELYVGTDNGLVHAPESAL